MASVEWGYHPVRAKIQKWDKGAQREQREIQNRNLRGQVSGWKEPAKPWQYRTEGMSSGSCWERERNKQHYIKIYKMSHRCNLCFLVRMWKERRRMEICWRRRKKKHRVKFEGKCQWWLQTSNRELIHSDDGLATPEHLTNTDCSRSEQITRTKSQTNICSCLVIWKWYRDSTECFLSKRKMYCR